jgi:hypothetical protein
MHATKDHWRTLKWVVDIDRLIRAEKHIDWKLLASLAKAFGISRMLGVGIGLARLLLDTPIPDAFPLLGKHSSRDLSPICDRLFDPDRRRSRIFRCLGINPLYLRLCDDWPARLTYLYRSLAMPRPEDEVLFGTALANGPTWGLRRPFLVVGRCASRMGRPRSDGIAPFTH